MIASADIARARGPRRNIASWLYISPLVLVLIPFFVVPILVVLVASFLEHDGFGGMIPHFTLANYASVFTAGLTWKLYLSTIKFAALTWGLTLVIGFWIAYFLVFHVRNQLLAIGLFLLCTVPFWTSNIIRMISWIPLLGKNGLINSALVSTAAIDQQLEFLLFSDFAVVVAYTHQLTIFMIVPIFNATSRIVKRTLEAARDADESRFEIMSYYVVPLIRKGVAIGKLFVLTLVIGEFFAVKPMSGGGSATVGFA